LLDKIDEALTANEEDDSEAPRLNTAVAAHIMKNTLPIHLPVETEIHGQEVDNCFEKTIWT